MAASITSRWVASIAGGRILVEVLSATIPERIAECASARGLDL